MSCFVYWRPAIVGLVLMSLVGFPGRVTAEPDTVPPELSRPASLPVLVQDVGVLPDAAGVVLAEGGAGVVSSGVVSWDFRFPDGLSGVTDFLDVLPAVGDSRGSTFSGSWVFRAVATDAEGDVAILCLAPARPVVAAPDSDSVPEPGASSADGSWGACEAGSVVIAVRVVASTPGRGVSVLVEPVAGVGQLAVNTASLTDEDGLVLMSEPTEVTVVGSSLHGVVWQDTNFDGRHEDDEPKLSDVRVELVDRATGVVTNETHTRTDGEYRFGLVAAGEWLVQVDKASLPAGLGVMTKGAVGGTPVSVLSESVESLDFGFAPTIAVDRTWLVRDFVADEWVTPDMAALTNPATTRWQLALSNTGSVAVENVVVSDSMVPGCNGPVESADGTMFEVGESLVVECLASDLVDATNVRPPVVSAHPADAAAFVDRFDLAGSLIEDWGLAVGMAVNGRPGDSLDDAVLIPAGETVEASIEVTASRGLSELVVLVDGVPVDCPKQVLHPGQPVICTTEITVGVGSQTVAVTAEGSAGGVLVLAHDAVAVFGAAPGLAINGVLAVGGGDVLPESGMITMSSGESLDWALRVSNSGNTGLANIEVAGVAGVKPMGGDINQNRMLDTNEVWVYTASAVGEGTGLQETVFAVTGVPAGEIAAADTAGRVVAEFMSSVLVASPQVGLGVLIDDDPVVAGSIPTFPAGTEMGMAYLVTNDGDTKLVDIAVTSDGDPVLCPADSLIPSGSMVCHATVIVGPGDALRVGSVTAFPVDEDGGVLLVSVAGAQIPGTVSASVPAAMFGVVVVVKVSAPTLTNDADQTGDTTRVFALKLEDGANGVVDEVGVVDDNGTPDDLSDDLAAKLLSGDTDENGVLSRGEEWLFEATSIRSRASVVSRMLQPATAADIKSSGTPGDLDVPVLLAGGPVLVTDGQPTQFFGATPSLQATIVGGNDSRFVMAGTTSSWLVQITNTGNTVIGDMTAGLFNPSGKQSEVTTPLLVSGDKNEDGLLGLNEVWLFEATTTAPTNPGLVTSSMQVAGIGFVPSDLTQAASTLEPMSSGEVQVATTLGVFIANPSIDVRVRTSDPDSSESDQVDGADALVEWEVQVTNTGNTPLDALTVITDHEVLICPTGLGIAETVACDPFTIEAVTGNTLIMFEAAARVVDFDGNPVTMPEGDELVVSGTIRSPQSVSESDRSISKSMKPWWLLGASLLCCTLGSVLWLSDRQRTRDQTTHSE